MVNKGYKKTEIGIIPEDWNVKAFLEVGTYFKGSGISMRDVVFSGYPCIMYGDIYVKFDTHFSKCDYHITAQTASRSTRAQHGDLFFTASGETAEEIGKCVSYQGKNDIFIGGDIIAIRPSIEYDMTLIELIVEKGVDFVDDLPESIKSNEEAVAETIEQNVRKKIIEKQNQNPLYYSKMSELLMQIIADRKAKKISYKEYLEKIVDASKKVEKPEEYSNYPDEIKHSAAMRALYDNIPDITPESVIELHEFILRTKPDSWKGDKTKTRALRRSIRRKVKTDAEEEAIFEIVKKQREYY